MKATVKEIADAYALLGRAGYSKMETADLILFNKAMRPLKKIALEYEDFKADSMRRLTPENAEELLKTLDEFNAMKPKERAVAVRETKFAEAIKANANYNKALMECLKEEDTKVVELDFAPLTEDGFVRLMMSNQWNMEQVMLAEGILC